MGGYTAFILDDELYGRENLAFMLAEFFPEIKVIGKFSNIPLAETAIQHQVPHILFLDIRLENSLGFEFLDRVAEKPMATVIVSGYDDYGIVALKYGVVDYILKPIHEEEFKKAVKKAITFVNNTQLLAKGLPQVKSSKLKIPTSVGFTLVEINEIKRLQSDGNYTNIHLIDHSVLVVSKTMKEFEPFLDKMTFYRVHRSHIINLDYIKGYLARDGGYVVLSDDSLIEISRTKHKEFMELVAQKFNSIS
jgi:two-component system LytT family response regulator